MAALTIVQAGVTLDGDCEVAWEPSEATATSYHVYRAPSSGGSFSEIAEVDAPLNYYLDTAYSAGNVYKVSWDNGTEQTLSSEVTPTPCHDTTVNPAQPRHDTLVAGSERHLAHWSNLHYSQVALRAIVKGATSTAGLFDDGFTAGSPQAELTAGTVTACGGGSCTLQSGAGAWAILRYNGHVPAATFGVVVDVQSAGEDILIGYGLDATHGVFARFDNSANTIDMFGIDGGDETSIISPASYNLTTFKLAIEACNQQWTCWVDQGSGWEYVGSQWSIYDLRDVPTLALWAPLVATGKAAGSVDTILTRFRCAVFSGDGGMREVCPVTTPDGKPVRSTAGNYLVAGDRMGPVPDGMGNVVMNVSFSVQLYNPETATLTPGAIASISLLTEDDRAISGQDGKIVYDEAAGIYHLWNNDWSNVGPNAFPGATTLYYQAWDAPLEGFVHMDDASIVSLPAAWGSTPTFYGVDAIRIAGTWYIAGTKQSGWQLCVVSGSDPAALTTLVAEDGGRSSEGYTWLPLGSRLYLIGGSINDPDGDGDWGQIYVWDFSDLATLTYLGHLDYPNPNDDAVLPQQPSILWYRNGDRAIPQLLGFQSEYFTRYADAGPLQVCEPSFELTAQQFDEAARTVAWRRV